MLISKFDLYQTEWLDLVFAKRNKEYGAYYLRQHYARNILKAMIITFVSIISAALIIGFLIRVKPITQRIIQVDNTLYIIPPTPPKTEPKKIKPAASKPIPPVKTIKFIPPVVTSNPVDLDPPKLVDLDKAAVGPIDIKVPGNGEGTKITNETGAGGSSTGDGPDKDTNVHIYADVMPEPYGGAAGWNKFLQKNLKYPAEAIDKNISGRVLVSFVVEKDGHLSSIMVDRGAGFGMDEEALRVLKLSKAWKPGYQNGQPVRVKYTIPIRFSISQ
jgi:protein TonB